MHEMFYIKLLKIKVSGTISKYKVYHICDLELVSKNLSPQFPHPLSKNYQPNSPLTTLMTKEFMSPEINQILSKKRIQWDLAI